MIDTSDSPKTMALDVAQGVVTSSHELPLGIDHLAIAVENLTTAVNWYVNVLGFRLVDRRTTNGKSTSMHSAVLTAGSATLVLIQGTCPRSQVSRFIRAFGPGVQHIALGVSNLDSALTRVIDGGGAAVTNVIEDVGIRQVFLRRDPESGVRVELIEKRGGTFSDHTVEQLFRKFEADDLY